MKGPQAAKDPDHGISTEIASHDVHHIWVRGIDLTEQLMGRVSFSEMVLLLISGELPSRSDARLLDAVLVSLMEHGLTPSAMVTRVTHSVAPEAIQGAIAAGLLGAGSVVLGSMEECGQVLMNLDDRVSSGEDQEETIASIVQEHLLSNRRLPGFGHSIHTEGDPRARTLYALAEECGRLGVHMHRLRLLEKQATVLAGRPVLINATGAIAAILLEMGIPWELHRGFALVSRSAGLLAHVAEENQRPIASHIREVLRGRRTET